MFYPYNVIKVISTKCLVEKTLTLFYTNGKYCGFIFIEESFLKLRAVHSLKCCLFSNQHKKRRRYRCNNSKPFMVNYIWELMNSANTPISQIPQCMRQIFHNVSFCDRDVHTCAHFCYKIAYCGIFVECIVEFVQLVYRKKCQQGWFHNDFRWCIMWKISEQDWGLPTPRSLNTFVKDYFIFQNCDLYPLNRVHIWQAPTQPSCGDTYQICTWYSRCK